MWVWYVGLREGDRGGLRNNKQIVSFEFEIDFMEIVGLSNFNIHYLVSYSSLASL